MMTYPGYQRLPKGIKQMLVESESFFFEEQTTFIRRDGKRAFPAVNGNTRPFTTGRGVSNSWKN